MKIITVIDGKKYFTISQSFKTYQDSIEGNASFNTYYKKFVKYKHDLNVEGIKYGGVVFYSQNIIENFIKTYTEILNYNKTKKNVKV
jgi:hypothetical protein